MRSLHLFVVVVGVMPLFTFGATVWLTGGAPFAPFEVPADSSRDAIRGSRLAPAPGQDSGREIGVVAEFAPPAGQADLARLHRLARTGDAEAVLLLTILDDIQVGAVPPAR